MDKDQVIEEPFVTVTAFEDATVGLNVSGAIRRPWGVGRNRVPEDVLVWVFIRDAGRCSG
jgi:hypothetical protein